MSDTTDPAARLRAASAEHIAQGRLSAPEYTEADVTAVVAELEQLRKHTAAVEGAWRCWHCGTQHGPVLCTACVDRVTEKARVELEQQRDRADRALAIIARVTNRMNGYDRHGSRMVNVRQVLNLLSPTWPDGNYSSEQPETTGADQ